MTHRNLPRGVFNLRIARLIGRKDYSGAISQLEATLQGQPTDVSALELIANCHRWSGADDKAIDTAARILEIDVTKFSALKMLSEIHAERGNPELAVSFVRRALESYPAPLEPVSPKLVTLARWIFRIVAPLKRVRDDEFRVLEDPNEIDRKWYAWAKEYLAWYDGVS